MVLNSCHLYIIHDVPLSLVLAIHYFLGTLSLKFLLLLKFLSFYELSQADCSASETIFLKCFKHCTRKISFQTFYTSSYPTNLSINELITFSFLNAYTSILDQVHNSDIPHLQMSQTFPQNLTSHLCSYQLVSQFISHFSNFIIS